MKKILVSIIALLFILGAAAGIAYWRASQGAPASSLETQYLQRADRFLDVAGARIRIREEGEPTSLPIILIHGFTHSLETWDGWANALKSDYRVIRYDLLGHGLTGPDPKERYAPEERAAFIGDVMDALQIEHAAIAGNSLGGLAAWRFAANNPDRTEALVLVSPGAYPLNGAGDEPAEIPAAMKAYLMTAPEAGVRASAEIIYGDDEKITDARLASMRDMMRREGNGEAMIRSLEEFTLPDPTAALAGIEAPTLILWGEEDAVIPIAQGRTMEETMPNAQFISYPGVGHAAQEEAPEATVADAMAFLAKHYPAKGE